MCCSLSDVLFLHPTCTALPTPSDVSALLLRAVWRGVQWSAAKAATDFLSLLHVSVSV